jgi:leader peptidase (prepilin peptidase)/N-methyltransferase
VTNLLTVIYWAVAGAAIGSFVNLAVDRLPRGQSILKPRSHCPKCGNPVALYDLVPVLNWLWLRGRCRYCRNPIPVRSPLVELLGAALMALVGWQFGTAPQAFVAAFVVTVCMVTVFIDLERHLILDVITAPALVIVLAVAPWTPGGEGATWWWAYVQALAGIGVGLGALLVIYVLSRGGFGEGDVKFGAFMGAALAWKMVAVALPVAFFAGGAVGLVLLALRLRGRKSLIPFGPFLAGAMVITLFAGDVLREWYFNLLRF